MKKSILLIFAIAMLIFSVSCDNKIKKNHDYSKAQQTESHQQEQPVSQQKDEDEHGHESDETLQLNNRNLWEANIETNEGIETMKNLVNSFSMWKNMEAYINLKQDLEKEFGTIISKCTMTGEAHNQLHKYLVPMKDLFNGLVASDLAIRKASLNKINVHLEEYTKYFN